jgi:hypothetical protein
MDHVVADFPYKSDNDDDDKRKKNKKDKRRRKSLSRRRATPMWSLGIVMLPQVMKMIVMMIRRRACKYCYLQQAFGL